MSNPTAPNKRVHRSPEQWQSLVDQFERSGLSQRAFCKETGLPYGTFARWRRRLQADTAVGDAGNKQLFVELLGDKPQHNGSHAWDVELELGDGIMLRLRRQPC